MAHELGMFFIIYALCVSTLPVNSDPILGPLVVRANDNEYHYVASITLGNLTTQIENNHICTGILITKTHVLTAAHCLQGKSLADMRVILGSVDLREGKQFRVNSSITYNQWAEENDIPKKFVMNDIGLIKLSEPVDKVITRPAELSTIKNYKFFEKDAVIVGWGAPNGNASEPASRYLSKAGVKILEQPECEDVTSRLTPVKLTVPEKYLCSKGEPYALATCGDSGGPILIKNTLVGITKGVCPTSTNPYLPQSYVNDNKVNIHSSVYFYKDFITSAINKY